MDVSPLIGLDELLVLRGIIRSGGFAFVEAEYGGGGEEEF